MWNERQLGFTFFVHIHHHVGHNYSIVKPDGYFKWNKMSTIYQNWEYAYHKGEQQIFSIKPDANLALPKTLFKYYALSEHSVDAITHFYIYASHPNQLNDSFDCSENILDFASCPEINLKCMCGELYNQGLLLFGGLQGLRENAPHIFKLLCYKKIGIISLCQERTNPQMWANYANNDGFCVEFYHEAFPFAHNGPFPMHYVEKYEQVRVEYNIQECLLVQTNVKTKDWENEHEWRILASNPEDLDFEFYERNGMKSKIFNQGDEHDRKLRYPLSAIRSITLAKGFLIDSVVRFYQVSANEHELVLIDSPLKESLLNMLSNPKYKFIVQIAFHNKQDKMELCPVCIIHISDKTYRIIKL